MIIINGEEDNVRDAKLKIENILLNSAVRKVDIAKEYIGVLVGKNGNTLKSFEVQKHLRVVKIRYQHTQ